MTEHESEWDYCDVKFQLRYKGEDSTRAGLKQMWLVFQARASGANRSYLAGESTEIPIAANVIGVSFVPQERNPSHRNIHQNLLDQLQAEGWERLPERGGSWWETRLRRLASRHRPTSGWFKRLRDRFSQARPSDENDGHPPSAPTSP